MKRLFENEKTLQQRLDNDEVDIPYIPMKRKRWDRLITWLGQEVKNPLQPLSFIKLHCIAFTFALLPGLLTWFLF